MDLLRGNVKEIYLKYLAAAFGSALISSIYSLVDTAMVGQYHGPAGTAAMAVIAPIWNMIYSLGLLTGIGGSVLYSTARGKGDGKTANGYFTAALFCTIGITLLLWGGILFYEEPLLRLFGADDTLLALAQQYLLPIKYSVPVFLASQLLSAFLRNDSNPGLATRAVLVGGVFNVVGDYLLVFTFDLGILGAGIATVGGAVLTLLVMLSHFFTARNTLRLTAPAKPLAAGGQIVVTGFSTFFIDIAMGILTMLFNRQIMAYAGADALAVYGIIVNVSTFVQCCAYGIGHAAQPILSINFGGRKGERIRTLVRYSLVTVAVVSAAWVAVILAVPNAFTRLFMAPTPEVLAIAPGILRTYGLSFALLPFNIFSTFYFQSVMRPGTAFAVSLARGMALSGGLILLLPLLFGGDSLWLAMPLTELAVAGFVAVAMARSLRSWKGK